MISGLLAELHIENLAIIEKLHIPFSPGLNVLTGETGVGKSIIVNALGLLVGAKVEEFVRTGEEEGVVEAFFDLSHVPPSLRKGLKERGIDGEEVVIKRVISAKGRGRAYINGQLATVQMLTSVAEELIDIYGQHHHQLLRRPERHLDLVDEFAGLMRLREEYEGAFRELRALQEEIKRLQEEGARWERERELYEFQLKELISSDLRPGEEEELREERAVLRNRQKLIEGVRRVEEVLYSQEGAVAEGLSQMDMEMASLVDMDRSLSPLRESLSQALLLVEEVARELRGYAGRLEHDPLRLEEVEGRLALIERLKKKYGAKDIRDLMAYAERIEEELERSSGTEQKLRELRRREEEVTQLLGDLA